VGEKRFLGALRAVAAGARRQTARRRLGVSPYVAPFYGVLGRINCKAKFPKDYPGALSYKTPIYLKANVVSGSRP
jgi:hypothetical protein